MWRLIPGVCTVFVYVHIVLAETPVKFQRGGGWWWYTPGGLNAEGISTPKGLFNIFLYSRFRAAAGIMIFRGLCPFKFLNARGLLLLGLVQASQLPQLYYRPWRVHQERYIVTYTRRRVYGPCPSNYVYHTNSHSVVCHAMPCQVYSYSPETSCCTRIRLLLHYTGNGNDEGSTVVVRMRINWRWII